MGGRGWLRRDSIGIDRNVPEKVDTVRSHKSKRKHQNRVFTRYTLINYTYVKPPGAPRQSLGDVSPNQRLRVGSARDYNMKISYHHKFKKPYKFNRLINC